MGASWRAKVQAVRKVTIPASAEMTVQCRVTTKNYYPLGIIEGETGGALLAASLNRPERAGRVMVRCLNLTNQPLTISSWNHGGDLHWSRRTRRLDYHGRIQRQDPDAVSQR